MTTLISTAILLLSLGGAGVSPTPTTPQQWPAEVVLSDDRPSDAAVSSLRSAIRAEAAWRSENAWERASRTVFYVPGSDFSAEGMAETITEDMAIMCRIFDKATAWAFWSTTANVGSTLQFGDVGSDVLVFDSRFSTQGLYLDGYGAIFFIPVGFPLAPTGQEQAPAAAESPADPLWSQTANELRGIPQGRSAAESPRYDPQKVENLKTAVIGVLRHASNIRTGKTRKPQDVIDVVISSRMGQTHHYDWTPRSGAWQQAADPTGSPAEMPTILILRTTKTDVDALAKGELTLEQFTQKVQVLKSWANAGRGTIRPTAPKTSISAPPQATRR